MNIATAIYDEIQGFVLYILPSWEGTTQREACTGRIRHQNIDSLSVPF